MEAISPASLALSATYRAVPLELFDGVSVLVASGFFFIAFSMRSAILRRMLALSCFRHGAILHATCYTRRHLLPPQTARTAIVAPLLTRDRLRTEGPCEDAKKIHRADRDG